MLPRQNDDEETPTQSAFQRGTFTWLILQRSSARRCSRLGLRSYKVLIFFVSDGAGSAIGASLALTVGFLGVGPTN